MISCKKGTYRYSSGALSEVPSREGFEKTMAYSILTAHNLSGDNRNLKIRFDGMASHDITYVGIIQTARASGMKKFPLPYVLTNCHNSLCAVGGTINEDDHLFGLSAAKKYGGIYVPAHQAVIHQYMREKMAGCGKMLLGSDSHTRYGALGTMGVGEGGPELVKQLLEKTYDIAYPEVIAVHLIGKPKRSVGPQDVALALVKATFETGFVKNKVLEFIGEGIANLSVEFRNGIDVMTTETTCLSSVWETDDKVRGWYDTHQRSGEFREIHPADGAVYDGVVEIDLSTVEPMIALPFHPSNAYTIKEFRANAKELLAKCEDTARTMMDEKYPLPKLTDKVIDGEVYVEQGIVAGCSGGTFENIMTMTDMMRGKSIGNNTFTMSLYPASGPQMMAILKNGAAADLAASGVVLRSAFCGPCFGAGDVPANGGLSIRHATRNFPNREGAKPANGQMAYVALMDARSIAATAINGGKLTGADEIELPEEKEYTYEYDPIVYANRIYDGWGRAQEDLPLRFGPNIADWPEQIALPENLILKVASAIYDPVTTTDELIPSGETSSYRSNPLKLSEFALSRKDPKYVSRAKAVQALEKSRREGNLSAEAESLLDLASCCASDTGIASVVFALKPGDGSAREQAASCQRVLGGCANIAAEYATKRYRSNVVNWGMLPFILKDAASFGIAPDDVVIVRGIKSALEAGNTDAIPATLLRSNGEKAEIKLSLPGLTKDERDIILKGCLINYYAG